MRKLQLQTDNYYHIFNRGVDKRDIFLDEKDFIRFIVSMREFNNLSTDNQRDYEKRTSAVKLSFGYPKLSFLEMPKLVEFICYSLCKNHFHFIVKQLVDDGTSMFMHKLCLGYTKYFNFKHKRSGSLFQGTYKAKYINKDSYLLKLSCYINGNSEIHKMCKADNWKWSSYQDYLNLRKGMMCNKNIILKDFKDIQEYKELTNYVIKDSGEIKEYILE